MGYRPLTDVLSKIPMKERVGNVNKNRNVSKNSDNLIEISKSDIQTQTLKKLITVNEKNKKSLSKQVKWKDEMNEEV